MLESARNEYKSTYDELVKFEQDHCTIEAASVPWEKLCALCFDIYFFFSLLLNVKVDQKNELRELFIKCNKKDCSLNHMMSRARPLPLLLLILQVKLEHRSCYFPDQSLQPLQLRHLQGSETSCKGKGKGKGQDRTCTESWYG